MIKRGDNSWSQHLSNAEAFAAENFVIGVGGTLAHIQLFNPVASGVRVRLRSVHAVSPLPVLVNVNRYDTPLTTLGVPVGFAVGNLLGGTNPPESAEMRSEQPVGILGSVFWQLNALASTPAIYPPNGREWGHDLLEGQGVLLQAGAGVTLIVNWHWVEIPL